MDEYNNMGFTVCSFHLRPDTKRKSPLGPAVLVTVGDVGRPRRDYTEDLFLSELKGSTSTSIRKSRGGPCRLGSGWNVQERLHG